jgi:hypothetical protein
VISCRIDPPRDLCPALREQDDQGNFRKRDDRELDRPAPGHLPELDHPARDHLAPGHLRELDLQEHDLLEQEHGLLEQEHGLRVPDRPVRDLREHDRLLLAIGRATDPQEPVRLDTDLLGIDRPDTDLLGIDRLDRATYRIMAGATGGDIRIITGDGTTTDTIGGDGQPPVP